MAFNPFRGVQARFLQKPKGIVDMNYLMAGRKRYEHSIGGLKCQYGYRTGFFRGNVDLGEVPITEIKRVTSAHNPEGIDWIMPFKPGTPGYHLFHSLPLARLAQMETRLAEMELEIQAKVESAMEIKSFAQLQETVFNIVGMLQNIRREVETIRQEPTLAVTPTQAGVQA